MSNLYCMWTDCDGDYWIAGVNGEPTAHLHCQWETDYYADGTETYPHYSGMNLARLKHGPFRLVNAKLPVACNIDPADWVATPVPSEPPIDMNEYTQACLKLRKYADEDSINYLVTNLASEAGELAGVYAKQVRKYGGGVAAEPNQDETYQDKLIDELGDVLWHVAVLAHALGLTVEQLGAKNLQKLRGRESRGEIVDHD